MHAGGSGDRPADIGLGFAQTGDVAADRVVLRATLRPDGDAEWRIAYRIELTDDNTTAAFESLQTDIRANRSAYVSRFETRMATTVGAAENATGREMAATNFSVSAQRNPFPTSTDYGVVAYTFTWEGFAATQGDRLVAGDALAGLFLDSGTVLTVAWPDGYEVRGVAPEADERSETAVTWRGERNFGPDQPRVTVAPAGAVPSGRRTSPWPRCCSSASPARWCSAAAATSRSAATSSTAAPRAEGRATRTPWTARIPRTRRRQRATSATPTTARATRTPPTATTTKRTPRPRRSC
ncbi:DUF7345 domain-containing protein [Halobaculum litoreum]|uniref:DUF7345 domain-containing protein n=1 Tax=Halobaculum litoreum TaxID=3031998 RepID=A0ABD5XKM9_9EURY|nr:hypothetical protein [Halobaculum sp. DT92]